MNLSPRRIVIRLPAESDIDCVESQAAPERIPKQEFQRFFKLWERHWVMRLNHEGDPLNEAVLNCKYCEPKGVTFPQSGNFCLASCNIFSFSSLVRYCSDSCPG